MFLRPIGGTLLLDIWFVTNLTRRLLDDALRPAGLTADEFGLYSLICGFGPVTQTQIARWTGMPLTTVAGAIRRIGGRGHLSEAPHPDDARSRVIALTDAGVEITFTGAQILTELLPRLVLTLRAGEGAVRAAMEDLDLGLRELVGAAPRPYPASATDAADATDPADQSRSVTYSGPALTATQNAEVRRYIDWIRARDTP